MNAIGQQITRPINDWCPEGDMPTRADGLCNAGETPGPDVAEGWDDWGPFYGPMYHQHIGLDSSTVEMCMDSAASGPAACGGRAGARIIQNTVHAVDARVRGRPPRRDVPRRARQLHPRRRRRAAAGVLPGPVQGRVPQLDAQLPAGVRDPVRRRAAQRRRGQPPRRVGAVQRHRGRPGRPRLPLRQQTFEEGSYVIWMAQPRRGLADTALSIGVDVSPRIQRLYAPPAAWSHGYLWGADTVTIPDGARFSPRTDEVLPAQPPPRRRRVGPRERGGLRARSRLTDRGAHFERGARGRRAGVAHPGDGDVQPRRTPRARRRRA